MSKIITASKLNRLWKNGVLKIKENLEGKINSNTSRIDMNDARIGILEETGGVLTNKLPTYEDILVNQVEGYIPDALAVKEGFTELETLLRTAAFVGTFEETIDVPANGVATDGCFGWSIPDGYTFGAATIYCGSSIVIPSFTAITNGKYSVRNFSNKEVSVTVRGYLLCVSVNATYW